MKLYDHNINAWKLELDKQMEIAMGVKDYTKTCVNINWLQEYYGCTVDDAVADAVYAWMGFGNHL
jgi:hypothetical protein